MGVDTLCLIPPTHTEKYDVTYELVTAAKSVGVPNVCFMSAAGTDLAERDKQPRLREFIDLEHLVLSSKGDSSTETGHSPVVIRAGFYAENLLLYAEQMRTQKVLPLPAGDAHKFAPVALGDIAQVAATVLASEGPHGFGDNVRGQLIVMTGPMMLAGKELANAASQALGVEIEYENVSEREAKRILQSSPLDPSEVEYILEYYSLIREGKTNYISTHAFHDLTGGHPTELKEWFEMYKEEFAEENGEENGNGNGKKDGDGRQVKKRKINKK